MEVEAIDLAAPHNAPYQFSSTHGYQIPDTERAIGADDAGHGVTQVGMVQAGDKNLTADGSSDASDADDFSFDEEENDVSDDELSTANPADYTKAYNRQRRLHDPTIPLDQKPKSNPQKPKANVSALIDDQITSLSRHAGKIKLDAEQSGLGTRGDKGDHTDRANRATSEQVLDPKTRMILLQMINRGIVSEINGCISTGKEANVYHAVLNPEDVPDAIAKSLSSEEPTSTAQSSTVQPVDTKPQHLAIKIFKTSILTFRDRSAYIEGEFRFRNGYKHRSNHSMVRLWAEKEFRNLKRLHGAGLPVPEPIYLRAHVLVMGFIGSKKGWSAPLLRDVSLEDILPPVVDAEDQHARSLVDSKPPTSPNNQTLQTTTNAKPTQSNPWTTIYQTLLTHIRTMYQTCQLVHADLSEFNILYPHHPTQQPQGKAYIIDVGQSVSPSHPNALAFLRNDLHNLTIFFGKQHGVPTLAESTAFGFVTADKAPLDTTGMMRTLEKLAATEASTDDDRQREQTSSPETKGSERPAATANTAAKSQESKDQDEQVFRQQYIPQTLDQVYDVERDAEKVARGQAHELVYSSLLAPATKPHASAANRSEAVVVPKAHHDSDTSPASAPGSSSSSINDHEHASDDEDREGDRSEETPRQPRGKRFEDKTLRKEHKAAVKEEKREKRKTKMPKHVKKKMVEHSSRGHRK